MTDLNLDLSRGLGEVDEALLLVLVGALGLLEKTKIKKSVDFQKQSSGFTLWLLPRVL